MLFAPDKPKVSGRFTPRDFQVDDCAAIMEAWCDGSRGVVCRHSTGLGKSVCIAELCRLVEDGRILVVVDVSSLAADLWRTIRQHTQEQVGLLTGDHKAHWTTARVVVATVQSLYAGADGEERYREFAPDAFDTLLIDEMETSIADRYSETLRYFVENNPACKMAGFTATPFRGDGRGMGELYDFANEEPGRLNRDILWAVMNGWLVKPRQAFVRCSLDFSTLKLRKDSDGDADYSEADLAKILADQDEAQWMEMANAIHYFAKGEPSIVICPNSVDVAKLVSHYLCGAGDERDNQRAEVVYGQQGQKAKDLIAQFKRGAFPYIVSVALLYKGFDADRVRNVFMLRKTRSRRLYEQALGRATRPLAEIRDALHDAPDAETRRKIIEESAKPVCTMVDLVGVHPDAKDLGVIDILGSHLSESLRERTKQNSYGKGDGESVDVGEAAREAKRELDDERERQKRSLAQVSGTYEVEVTDDIGKTGNSEQMTKPRRGGITDKQLAFLIALGVKPETAMPWGKRQAGAVIQKYKDNGAKPDWSRVRKWERAQEAGDDSGFVGRKSDGTVEPSNVPPGLFHQQRLEKLGYTGPMPETAADAIALIREQERAKR